MKAAHEAIPDSPIVIRIGPCSHEAAAAIVTSLAAKIDQDGVGAFDDAGLPPSDDTRSCATLDVAPDTLIGLDEWLARLSPAQAKSAGVAAIVSAARNDLLDDSLSIRALCAALTVYRDRLCRPTTTPLAFSRTRNYEYQSRGAGRTPRRTDAELRDEMVRLLDEHDGRFVVGEHFKMHTSGQGHRVLRIARSDPDFTVGETNTTGAYVVRWSQVIERQVA